MKNLRNHLLNTCELLFLSMILFSFAVLVRPPLHETGHYVTGLLDPNVESMKITLWGEPKPFYSDGVRIYNSTSYVDYYLKNYTNGMSTTYEQREWIADGFYLFIIVPVISSIFYMYKKRRMK